MPKHTWKQTSKSDFGAGINNNVDISTSPGDVILAPPYLGSGANGALTVSEPIYIDTIKTVTSQSNSGTNIVHVSSRVGLAVGQEILIIQMLGTGAGNWETGIIQSTPTATV